MFGLDEPRKVLAGIVWVALSIVGMDAMMPLIPTPVGIDIAERDSSLSVTVNAWLSCVMFTLPMVYFQSISASTERSLEAERARSERLLLNVLRGRSRVSSRSRGARSRSTSRPRASSSPTSWVHAARGAAPPDVVVELLSELFCAFDRMVDEIG